MTTDHIQRLTQANRKLQEQLSEASAEISRLRNHLTALGKAADAAAMVIATIEAEDTDEEAKLQAVMDEIGTWAPDAILGTTMEAQ